MHGTEQAEHRMMNRLKEDALVIGLKSAVSCCLFFIQRRGQVEEVKSRRYQATKLRSQEVAINPCYRGYVNWFCVLSISLGFVSQLTAVLGFSLYR